MSEPSTPRPDRALEVLTVLLLAMATVGSAWCAYQSTRWNGEESTFSRESTDDRVEATRQFTFGAQVVAYDSSVAADFAKAYLDGDTELQDFYRNVLARPEFVPVLDDWLAQAEAGNSGGGQLGSLMTDQAYLEQQLTGYEASMAASDAAADQAEEAGDNADDYIVLTLLLASALFFAGVTSSFRSRLIRLSLLTMSAVLLAITAGQLSTLPVI